MPGRGDEGERARHQDGRRGALEEPEDDECLERRSEPAQDARRPEPDEADREDAFPPVPVRDRAGQDDEGGEDREVAAVDVGLALEDPEKGGRQLLPDPLEGDVDDRAVEEHDRRAEDGRDHRPALASGHPRSLPPALPGSNHPHLIEVGACPFGRSWVDSAR
jgi:hypothetical protein